MQERRCSSANQKYLLPTAAAARGSARLCFSTAERKGLCSRKAALKILQRDLSEERMRKEVPFLRFPAVLSATAAFSTAREEKHRAEDVKSRDERGEASSQGKGSCCRRQKMQRWSVCYYCRVGRRNTEVYSSRGRKMYKEVLMVPTENQRYLRDKRFHEEENGASNFTAGQSLAGGVFCFKLPSQSVVDDIRRQRMRGQA